MPFSLSKPCYSLTRRNWAGFVGLSVCIASTVAVIVLIVVLVLSDERTESQAHQTRWVRTNQTSPDALNIVLFYADDWSWKTLGFLSDAVKTPNLDRMARDGMSFPSNCVTTSICWQSRATLYTGLYASVHKHYSPSDGSLYDGKTVNWSEALYPQLFSGGHDVGFFGKYHAPMPPEHLAYTFDRFRDYSGKHWMERDGRIRHVTELNKEDALEYLRSLRDPLHPRKRFALTVSFFATHAWDEKPFPDQYMPMNYSSSRYDANASIPVPRTATEEAWERMPWFFTEQNEGRRRWRIRFDGPDRYQESMKRLYRMATEVDDAIGAVVNELKEMGVYNSTLLVFTSDNGNFHGGEWSRSARWRSRRRALTQISNSFPDVRAEHGLADKWYPHEESIRVPLIIRDPRMPERLRGTANDNITLSVDLAPTLLSAAGLPVPAHVQGRDIAELYLPINETSVPGDPRKPWREDFFYEFLQNESQSATWGMYFIPSVLALVRKDYKYFFWPQSGCEQLFHVSEDPFEESDVINSTDPDIVEEIKARYRHLKNLSQQGHPV
jgi:arylsulfatase A-like enzyme